MKKIFAAFLTAAMVLSASGCAPKQDYLNNYERVTQPPKQTGETGAGETVSGKDSQPQAFEEMQWVYKPDGKGSMLCTITDVRAVKNDKDFDGNCFDYDGGIWVKEPEMDFLHYPDSVDGNGDLLDGYLILVDLTVENIDGRNEYLNHQTGEMVPRDGDPYIFRAMQFVFLQDRSAPTHTSCKDAHYYSDIWNLGDKTDPGENPMKFRLEPGETVSFQIGFLTNAVPETWSLEDDLILNTIQNGSLDGIWFPLDLEVPES